MKLRIVILFFLCIILVNIAAFFPSLFHLPRSDQKLFYIETMDVSSFPELVAKTYSYNRTRFFAPGDELLFRPLLFVVLSFEKWLWGYHFVYWQITGFILHLLIVWFFLRILLFIHRSFFSLILALFFSVIYVCAEMVVWHHLHGYLMAIILILIALYNFAQFIASSQTKNMYFWGMFISLTLAIFLYEYASVVTIALMAVLMVDRFKILKGKDQARSIKDIFKSMGHIWALFIPVACYFIWDIYDFISHHVNFAADLPREPIGFSVLKIIYFFIKVAILSWTAPLLPYFIEFNIGPRLGAHFLSWKDMLGQYLQHIPWMLTINFLLVILMLQMISKYFIYLRKNNVILKSILSNACQRATTLEMTSLYLSFFYILMIVVGRLWPRGEGYFFSELYHLYPIILFNLIFIYSVMARNHFFAEQHKPWVMLLSAILVITACLNSVQIFNLNNRIRVYFDHLNIERTMGWEPYFQAKRLSAFGFIHHIKGEEETAFDYYNQAILINPYDSTALNDRGVVYQQNHRLDLAIRDYTQAITINPFHQMAYSNRGTIYKMMGQYDQALADYNKVLSIYPDFDEGYYNRGQMYESLGDVKKAMADYNQALSLDPYLADAYLARGHLYVHLKEYDKALKDYNQSLEINPKLTDSYLSRAKLYEVLEKFDLAVQDYTKVIEQKADSEKAFCNRGIGYSKLGQYILALNDFNQALKINPRYASVYYNRSVLYQIIGEKEKASEDLMQAQLLGYVVDDAYKFMLQSQGEPRRK